MKDRQIYRPNNDHVSTEPEIDNDEIQSSLLAHYIQTYLSHSTNENTCGCLPVPFERATSHSWIRPSFDSDILEDQFKTSSAAHFLRRFQFALTFLIGESVLWLGFSIYRYPNTIYIPSIFAFMLTVVSLAYYASNRPLYSNRPQIFASCVAVLLAFSSLAFCWSPSTAMSHFSVVTCTILVVFSIFPLPPYVSLIICSIVTVSFNVLEYFSTDFQNFPEGFFVRLVCLLCINIIGFHIVVMVHVRMRGTFMKVGQRLLVRRQLEAEKQLKEKMIHSVMPPKVASWLLNPNPSMGDASGQRRPTSSCGDIRSMFRPFNMVRMDNVSILFADIVGFTRMSSNKTAEQIVDILNDLFNRFDELCILSGCEKISTLGDCYYCVSGCPEPRDDHAKCCVQMGLGMIEAIQEFDVERSEDVNMRVGVHTGTVLCGVVGTRRFKFDVWSHDVSFANKLESTGLAGRVHVSEQTVAFLDNAYELEDFASSLGVKTYLIAAQVPPPVTQVKMTLPSLPPSPLARPPARARLHSYNSGQKRPHYLSLITGVRSKFTSLPNVLSGSLNLEGGGAQEESSVIVPQKSSSIKWQFPFPKSWRPKEDILNMAMERLEVPRAEARLTADEELSLCPSATSRKDSGIKSASRRSSIQQQIYIMNGLAQQELMTHRVSGYFTSSRSSLPHSESDCETSVPCRLQREDGLGACFYSLRKQSDLQLIRCVRDITQRSYFVKVPLRSVTLQFRDHQMEAGYRQHAHHINENVGDSPVTLSTPRYNTFLDILVATVLLMGVTAVLLILQPPPFFLTTLAFFALFTQFVSLTLCCVYLSSGTLFANRPWSSFVIALFSNWYQWHALGIVLVSLPMLLSLIGFAFCLTSNHAIANITELSFLNDSQDYLAGVEFFDFYYAFLLLASLAHFCNFIQLNSFLKGSIAVISIVVFTSLIFLEQCQLANKAFVANVFFVKLLRDNVFLTAADGLTSLQFCCPDILLAIADCNAAACFVYGDKFLSYLSNSTASGNSSAVFVSENGHKLLNFLAQIIAEHPQTWRDVFINAITHFVTYDHYELLLNILIVLLLVILLNRELESNFRAAYFFNVESNKDKVHVQYLKNQADMLLENIIPKHVSEELKNRAKYCENHTDVGIIFASIVNFNMLYEETYSGGKEYLRYLNELISDFDELLTKFPNVEKIKTIGSTFMAAGGLNPELRKKNPHEHTHIYELMEFAKEMYRVLDDFNSDLLGFTLVLRVGFNIGEVTAGVIGSTKLLYDIWGDTVNVASRMDTTGVEGRIQVPSTCLRYLQDRYEFEPRGSVFVKGKGDIMVYLLKSLS